MTISRRLALGCASAFAVTGGSAQLSVASVLKSISTASSPVSSRNVQMAQLFQEMLIHRDETGQQPYMAVISLAAPDTRWFDICTLEDFKFRVLNHDYQKHGYRLRRVSAFNTRLGVRYAALWELASGPDWQSVYAMPLAKFEKASDDLKQRGYRMTHIDARVNYAAIWEKGDTTSQQVFPSLTLLEYEQQYSILTAQGFRPHRISMSAQGSVPSFAAIFEKATVVPWQSNHQMTATQFRNTIVTAKAHGYRLTDASGYMLGGKATFTGIWDKA